MLQRSDQMLSNDSIFRVWLTNQRQARQRLWAAATYRATRRPSIPAVKKRVEHVCIVPRRYDYIKIRISARSFRINKNRSFSIGPNSLEAEITTPIYPKYSSDQVYCFPLSLAFVRRAKAKFCTWSQNRIECGNWGRRCDSNVYVRINFQCVYTHIDFRQRSLLYNFRLDIQSRAYIMPVY